VCFKIISSLGCTLPEFNLTFKDDFINIVIEAGYCIDGFGVITGFIGESLEAVFNNWAKLVTG
jgi:hypothetical protein